MQRLWDKKHQEGGFSLIELLVVIVILGVLAGVVVFAVGGIQDKGEKSACKADYKTIQVAEEAYYAQNKAYATVDQLVTSKLLADASKHYTVTPGSGSYTIAVATGSTCTSPPAA